MTVGSRLREERQRLGLSQPAFAALADASKSALVTWEKDTSSPNANALIDFAEAGADILYVLTGQRTVEHPDNAKDQIAEQIAGIRRDVLNPSQRRLSDEDEQQADERVVKSRIRLLQAILKTDRALMTPDMIEEAEQLLDTLTNPGGLALLRAADRAMLRRKREAVRADIWTWFGGARYDPGEAVMYILTTMAIEYGVPTRMLGELVEEMHRDITSPSRDPLAGVQR